MKDAMKNDCTKWHDPLVDAVLTGTVSAGLQAHLSACAVCTEQFLAFQARRERLDAMLPLVAQGAEPSPDFRARVLAAAEASSQAKRTPPWLAWGLAGGTALLVAALITSFALRSRTSPPVPQAELATAQKLAQWRAPSDIFLETPGRELLRSTPKLGVSYLPVATKTDKEKRP
jgi:hypothetical protein